MEISQAALAPSNTSPGTAIKEIRYDSASQNYTTIQNEASQMNKTQGLQNLDPENAELDTKNSERFAVAHRSNDEPKDASSVAKTPKSSPLSEQGNRKKRKTLGDRKWRAEYLLQNPKSPLVNVDLLAMLKSERAWVSLSEDQQMKLVSLLPGGYDLLREREDREANILKNTLMSNSAFQSDVRMFQEDLAESRLQPAWLAKAKLAMEKRSRGEFDSWKEEETERFWGQKQRIDYSALAGESSKVKIEDLITSGCFQVDDRWLYIRKINKKGKGSILIEKEAKITSTSEGSQLTFSFPPGKHKYPSSKSGTDIIVECTRGPNALAMAIVSEVCKIENWRPGNAWKEFRCLRKNQDMGSPWEIRELYYTRNSSSTGKGSRS